ncbi:hypothetical protein [Burkholderia ubonensis]|uniref:hypothetical protein n=1 Tax=Burkholderia ubonensis TaxID=101571 RepID=UPI001FC8B1CC|nr:hypothetical protein [Burkholderia ubonensis]
MSYGSSTRDSRNANASPTHEPSTSAGSSTHASLRLRTKTSMSSARMAAYPRTASGADRLRNARRALQRRGHTGEATPFPRHPVGREPGLGVRAHRTTTFWNSIWPIAVLKSLSATNFSIRRPLSAIMARCHGSAPPAEIAGFDTISTTSHLVFASNACLMSGESSSSSIWIS